VSLVALINFCGIVWIYIVVFFLHLDASAVDFENGLAAVTFSRIVAGRPQTLSFIAPYAATRHDPTALAIDGFEGVISCPTLCAKNEAHSTSL
jgi:hypothetical protein